MQAQATGYKRVKRIRNRNTCLEINERRHAGKSANHNPVGKYESAKPNGIKHQTDRYHAIVFRHMPNPFFRQLHIERLNFVQNYIFYSAYMHTDVKMP